MVAFRWQEWLRGIGGARVSQRRRPNRARGVRIEGLEDRTLLTANLPVAVNDTYDIAADQTLNAASVLLNDTDADGDEISQAILESSTTNGTLSLALDGTFTYVPNGGFVGNDSFTYTARDGANNENSAAPAIVLIRVGSANSGPTANDDAFSINVNSTLNGAVTATDPDNDTLTFTLGSVNTSNGTLTLSSDGSFTYQPENGFVGQDSFTFIANDGESDSEEATITINVGEVGDGAPVATSKTVQIETNEVLQDQLTASDPDGDPLTYSIGSQQPEHGTVSINNDGTFTYTPDTDFSGTDSFTFKVNDGTQDSNEATVFITIGEVVPNNNPPVAEDGAFGTAINTQFIGNLDATDEDGDPLNYRLGGTAPQFGNLTINPDGSFTYSPVLGFQGTDSFTFIVNDGQDDSNEATMSILVGTGSSNNPPTANDGSFSTSINQAVSGTLTGSDPDGDTLTFVSGSPPSNGSVTINANGTFTYTPSAGFTGTDTFTYTVTDGALSSSLATVSITVGNSGENTAPVATPGNFSTATGVILNGELSATDEDGDGLTYSMLTTTSNGELTINQDGTFRYIPNAGFTGIDTFTFKVNDGTEDSASALVTINVGTQSENTPPVANPANLSTVINTELTGTLTATDADDDPLTFSQVTEVSHGTLNLETDGTFTYTPDNGFTGTDSFTYRVNDGTENSVAVTVTIVVTNVGTTSPTANSQTVNTALNTAFEGTLTGSDPDGDPLNFLVGSTQPANGQVTIAANGTFIYTPDNGFTGTDTFSFKVNDGTTDSAEATVTVNVGVENEVPTGDAITINTDVNTSFNGTLTGSDPEGDTLTFQSGLIGPQHGTVTINANGTFTYTPNTGFTGDDLFSFRVSDGTNTSVEALVTVHVGPTSNTPPMAFPQTINTAFNTQFNGTLTGLDVDDDQLTYSAGSISASHGTVVINANGTFTYTPDSGYTGDDLFSFVVNDGTANSIEAVVTVHVGAGENTIPIVTAGSGTVTAGTTFSGNLAPLASDIDGDTLTFAIVDQPTNGTITLSADGNFQYTPNSGFTGVETFTFRANDGTANSATATFTLNVTSTSSGGDFDLILGTQPGTIARSKKATVPLDPTASLENVDPETNFANAFVRASFVSGNDRRDKLVVVDGSIDVRGKKIRINGVEVARWTGGKRGKALEISFNSSANEAAVEAVLQHIGVRTTKAAPAGTRTVQLQVNADGATSTATIEANVAGGIIA